MKRVFFLLTVLIPVSLFLAGCSKGTSGGPATAEPPSKEVQEKMMKAQMELMNRDNKPAGQNK